MHRVVIYWLN